MQDQVLHALFFHRDEVREIRADDLHCLFGAEGFSAAIFDCDGTLVDSANAHLNAMQAAADDQGFEMSADWYRARGGLDRRSLFQEFRVSVGTQFDVDQACRASIDRFAKLVHLVTPIAPVLRFATALRAERTPMAVATNAERDVAQLSLSKIGAIDFFNPLVSISDDVKAKPSPEMFELAARGLRQSQDRVLVIEDSPQGVEAAKVAGMSVVQLVDA